MKKIVVLLVAVIGLGMNVNAQKKVAFYSGKEYIVMYSDGTIGYWDGNKDWNGRWSGDKPYIYDNFGQKGCRHQIDILLLDSNGKRIEWKNITLYGFNTYTWAIQSAAQGAHHICVEIPGKGRFIYK